MKNKRKIIGILLTIFILVFYFPLHSYSNYKDNSLKNYYGICLTPGEDETMLNFSWYSNKKNDSEIKIWEKNKNVKIHSGKYIKLHDNFISNKVTVVNLKDNTTYYYSYKCNGEWSKPIKYKTKNSKSFTFAFMGDPQIGASCKKRNSIKKGIKEDSLSWNRVVNNVLKRNKDISFIICAGDETNETENEKKNNTSDLEYLGFLSPICLQYTPLANAIGNHDKDNENFYNHFYMPNLSNLGKTVAGGDYYFTYGNTIFLFLNTNNLNIKEHEKFIEKSLNENINKKWRIVCFHHDIYGDGIHKNELDIEILRQLLPTILEKNKIDLVLCGHDHIYSRTYPLKNNKKTKDIINKRFYNNEKIEEINNPQGVIYITGGTSTGSKFYKSIDKKEEYVKFKYDKKNPVYTIININENKIIISTHTVDNNEMIDNKVIITK